MSAYKNVNEEKHMLTEVLGVRFDRPTYDLVQRVATAQGIGACDFVRVAVNRELARLSFLPAERQKALEVVQVK